MDRADSGEARAVATALSARLGRSLGSKAAGGKKYLTGDPLRVRRGQERHDAGDVGRSADPAQGCPGDEQVLQVIVRHCVECFGRGWAGPDGVDRYPSGAEFLGPGTSQRVDRAFGSGVDGGARGPDATAHSR